MKLNINLNIIKNYRYHTKTNNQFYTLEQNVAFKKVRAISAWAEFDYDFGNNKAINPDRTKFTVGTLICDFWPNNILFDESFKEIIDISKLSSQDLLNMSPIDINDFTDMFYEILSTKETDSYENNYKYLN